MSQSAVYIQWESEEAEDQIAQAVAVMREAVGRIQDHYTDATCWPGWQDDAELAVRLASNLLSMSVAEATSHPGRP